MESSPVLRLDWAQEIPPRQFFFKGDWQPLPSDVSSRSLQVTDGAFAGQKISCWVNPNPPPANPPQTTGSITKTLDSALSCNPAKYSLHCRIQVKDTAAVETTNDLKPDEIVIVYVPELPSAQSLAPMRLKRKQREEPATPTTRSETQPKPTPRAPEVLPLAPEKAAENTLELARPELATAAVAESTALQVRDRSEEGDAKKQRSTLVQGDQDHPKLATLPVPAPIVRAAPTQATQPVVAPAQGNTSSV